MSAPTPKPLYLAGTPTSSGSVQTEELLFSLGGGRATVFYSGSTLGDTLIYSGAGRVNSFTMHTQMQSGQAAVFYDAAVATSGGPFGQSGHKWIFSTPPTWGGAASGVYIPFNPAATVVDMPFQSGLCVNLRSGNAGVTISWTPEISPAFPNA